MKIDILTLFPEMFAPLSASIIKRATESNKIEIGVTNIRDFSLDAHKKCDDYPFGGGAGMVMMPQPIYDAIMSVKRDNSIVYFTSPRGKTFDQKTACVMSTFEHIIIVCGHYEGIDQRVIDMFGGNEISIGDYVLTGGELAAMVITDAVARLVDGVISKDSLAEESFSNNLLEYPQYTRPQDFLGYVVPEVLTSGHHQKIDQWRHSESVKITKQNRPDLLD